MKKQENQLISDASRKNRYSIRKFTVGAASIVVGATVLFGLGGEARAAETSATPQNNSNSTSNNTTGSTSTETSSQAAKTDTTTDASANTETTNTTKTTATDQPTQTNATSQQTTSDQTPTDTTTPTNAQDTASKDTTTTKNETQTNTQDTTSVQPKDATQNSSSTDTTKDAVTQNKTPQDTTAQDTTNASTVNETTPKDTTTQQTDASKAQTDTTQSNSTSSATPQKLDTSAQDTTTQSQTTQQGQTTNPSTSPKQETAQQATSQAQPVQDTNTTTSKPESTNLITAPSTDTVNTPQTLTAADTQQPATTTNTSGITENQQVQQLAQQAGVTAADTPQVAMAKMLQQSSNNKDANTIQATAAQPTASRRLMRSFSAPQTTSANPATATAAPAPTTFASPAQGSTAPITADALANGYIKNQTDATNAANTLSGRAWVVDTGTPSTMANGLTPVPEGTDVYMQWIDNDGAVSPVYTAKTNNQLSTSDGSQVGPGAYAFDLRDGWTDLNGKTHTYNATAGQDYRLWINDYQTPNGNTATMLRQAGGFYPGSYVDSVTNNNLGQFPLIGTNMQRTGIFMGIKPTAGYMTTPDAQQIHDTQGPLPSPAVSLDAKNTVSGKVWLETGAGDYANSGTGPNDNAADPQAQGYTVVMSSLTKAGADAYNTAVNSLPENERSAAAKTLLEAHPEYISATVYGETDQNGQYTLRFPDGTLNPSYMYGYVKNPEGNIVNTYSSFTNPEFRAPNTNLSWTPQTSPAQNLVQNPMWYNVNFAVVPTADINLDVLKYDTTTTPAAPGSNVDIALPGTTMSPLPTHIE